MSDYDKSLEDIIKERNLVNQRPKGNTVKATKAIVRQKQPIRNVPAPITINRNAASANRINDARKKIVMNRQSTMIDARNKLNRGLRNIQITDARQKLNRLQTTNQIGKRRNVKNSNVLSVALTRTFQNDTLVALNTNRKIGLQRNLKKQSVSMQRGGLTIIRKQESPVALSTPSSLLFSRTVNSLAKAAASENGRTENNSARSRGRGLAMQSKLKSQSGVRVTKRDLDDDDDDLEYATVESFNVAKKLKPNLSSGSSNLSQRLQLRLGANGNESNSREMDNYRIVVSNLHPNVTREDLVELFTDIGPLRGVEIIKQGTAVISFQQLDDAQKSVDVYHNRELDGQPMICKALGTQQQAAGTTRKAAPDTRLRANALIGQTGTMHCDRVIPSAMSRITPDVGTIHAALFRRTPSRTNANAKASITVTM